MGRAFFEHHPRASRKRWRHPADTVWKAHPLMAVIRDAVREALQYREVRHPDMKRQRVTRQRDLTIRRLRTVKAQLQASVEA